MTIIESVKERIKNRNIEPKAKWKFYVINFSWWLLFAILFVIMSIAFGITLYMFLGADWETTRMVASGLWGRLLLVMPRLWLALIIITTILAVWEFRKTKKGYRYDIVAILGTILIGSILLGSMVYASGLGERLDSLFTDNMSFYRGRLHQQMSLWDRAEQGLLIGYVVDIAKDQIILFAPGGIEWVVDTSSVQNDYIKKDQVIKIEGKVISKNVFKAVAIMPLEMRGFMKDHKPPMQHFMDNDGYMYFERFSSPPAYK